LLPFLADWTLPLSGAARVDPVKTIPAFLLAVLIAGSIHASEIQKDIKYAEAGGKPLYLDARVPDGPGPFPAVIVVHGGGWAAGNKAMEGEVQPILGPLTQGGFAWFSVDYRLSRVAHYPACIEDVEAAVQFVRNHAKDYKIDPDKIALSGDSAGGHIVNMVAVRATPDHPERRLAAVVCFYGPNDLVEDSFRRNGPSPSLQALFGLPPTKLDTATVKLLQDASPIAFVSPHLPPFLLLHGTADQSVDYPGSIIWKEDLDALGVPCELITIPHGVHVMGNWDKMKPPQTAYKAQVVAWLQAVFAQVGAPVPPAAPLGRRHRIAAWLRHLFGRGASSGPATMKRVAGWWQNAKAPDTSGTQLVRDGSGHSLAAPASSLQWTFDPATSLVHIEYPPGQGRDVPYAGSPDLSESSQDKITKAGVRPKVAFADWRYFPAQDLMISSNGEIFRRQAKEAAAAPL
jgi:acetyl esterase